MEPRIPKESPVFDAAGRWTRTWIMYFESLFDLSVQEAERRAQAAIDAALEAEAGGGAGTPAYVSDLIAGPDTTTTVTGATHGFTTPALLVQVYDDDTPRNAIAVGWTVDASTFDVVITFAAPQSDYYVVIK